MSDFVGLLFVTGWICTDLPVLFSLVSFGSHVFEVRSFIGWKVIVFIGCFGSVLEGIGFLWLTVLIVAVRASVARLVVVDFVACFVVVAGIVIVVIVVVVVEAFVVMVVVFARVVYFY